MRSFEIEPIETPDAWDHVLALGVDESPQAFNAVYDELGIDKLYPGTTSVDPSPRQVEAAMRTVEELKERGLINGEDI